MPAVGFGIGIERLNYDSSKMKVLKFLMKIYIDLYIGARGEEEKKSCI